MTGVQNDIELIEGTVNDLRRIYEGMKADFRQEELKDCGHLEHLMLKDSKRYRLHLAKHEVLGCIGYALVYVVNPATLWLDYIAIDAKFRSAGYGQSLFRGVLETLPEASLGMFIEVEIPRQGTKDYTDQLRRVRFYERLGAHRLDIDYYYPNVSGGYPMHLYFVPSADLRLLPKDTIKASISSALEYIHSDVPQRDEIFSKYRDSIRDHWFVEEQK